MAVRWFTEKPSELLNRKDREMRDIVVPAIARRAASVLKDDIKDLTPIGVKWTILGDTAPISRPSGELQRSIRVTSKGHWERLEGFRAYKVVVETRKHYANWVEYGTSPHIIHPKYANGAMQFVVGGKIVFSKSVHHPGTKGVHMFSRGVNRTQRKIKLIAEPILSTWASDNKIRINSLRLVS